MRTLVNVPEDFPKTPEQNMPYLLMKQVSVPFHEQIIGYLLMILPSVYFTGCLPRMRCCNIALARTQTQHFPPREVGYVALRLTEDHFCDCGLGNVQRAHSVYIKKGAS